MNGLQNQFEFTVEPSDPKALGGQVVSNCSRESSHPPDHQKRLRERFLANNGVGLVDRDLLEMLLALTDTPRDAKPVANRLLQRFGDLNRVLAAQPATLGAVKGVTQDQVCLLKLVEVIAHRMAQTRILRRDVISSWDALLTYCRTAMAHRTTEQFRILFLDNKNCLIADEILGNGTVDHVPVYPREVLRRALDLNASALILVHNHPSGDPSPSSTDKNMTKQICHAAEALGLRVHDHLVIGIESEFSFRSAGLI